MQATETRQASKARIMQALYEFTLQRPGLEFGNYGDTAIYRAESRQITRQAHDAIALLKYIDWHNSITADDLRKALFGGRLVWKEDGNGGGSLDYCTGQYFPVEYRAAVCRAMVSLIWHYFRDNGADDYAKIKKSARRELGLSVARRWFY